MLYDIFTMSKKYVIRKAANIRISKINNAIKISALLCFIVNCSNSSIENDNIKNSEKLLGGNPHFKSDEEKDNNTSNNTTQSSYKNEGHEVLNEVDMYGDLYLFEEKDKFENFYGDEQENCKDLEFLKGKNFIKIVIENDDNNLHKGIINQEF